MKILVTGGAGYIGSHVVKELLKSNHEVIVIDDLSSGKKEMVKEPAKLIVANFSNEEILDKLFKEEGIEAVMHFAAFKDAGESVYVPAKYYENNVSSSIKMLNKMVEHKITKIIFSSSAAVYGDVDAFPITEDFLAKPINPYGWSKLIIEQVLTDYDNAYGIKSVSLRYFNAGGADPEGELGNVNDKKEDLVSLLVEKAKRKEKLTINGSDWNTKDGTTVRDLVHVSDLATAHVKALEYLNQPDVESQILNLGSETGFTVKEITELTKKITGSNFEIVYGPRRKGDIEISIASSQKAKKVLGWNQKESQMNNIIKTAWEWENKTH